MKIKFAIWSILLLALVPGCKEDEDQAVDTAFSAYKLLILNEGNFGIGNADFSLLNPDSMQVINNVYELQNGLMLGDVLQSASIDNEFVYLVVNNSQKIVRVGLDDFVFDRQYASFSSPRFLAIDGLGNGIVTNYYENTINQFSVEDDNIISIWNAECTTTGFDICGNENVLIHESDYIVSSLSNNSVFTIDKNTNQLLNQRILNADPMYMEQDVEGDVWVLTYDFNGLSSILYELSATDLSIKRSITLSTQPPFSSMPFCFSSDGTKLYLLGDKVYRLNVLEDQISDLESIIEYVGIQNPNGVFVDPSDTKLYLTDAAGYTGNGRLVVYNIDSGLVIEDYELGPIPSKMYWINN